MTSTNVDEFLEKIRHLIVATAPDMSLISRLPDCLEPVSAPRDPQPPRRLARKPPPPEYWRQLRHYDVLNLGKLVKIIRNRIYEMSNDARKSDMPRFKIDFNLEVGIDQNGRTIYLRDLPKKLAEGAVSEALMKSHLLCKYSNGSYTVLV